MLQLKTMGTFEAKWSGSLVLQFDSDKTRALFAYLAVESDRTHRRASLAGLLWPEKPERAARHSLSQSIYVLHSILPDECELLRATPQSVEFNPQANLWLDTRVFKGLIQDAARHCPVSAWVCHACLENLEQAAGLFQGEFMPGFSLDGCETFESWLTVQRETLKLMLVQTLESLVTSLMNQGAYEKGLVYAQHWYSQDDFNESALRHVIRLLTVLGNRSEGLRFYQAFEERLHHELNAVPEPETTRLYQQLLNTPVIRKQHPVRSSLFYPLTPIQGRQDELGIIAQKLRTPDCRLLTILGPGGMGKTRLAQEACLNLQALFLDGVYWVDLDARQGEADLLLLVARKVGLAPRVMPDVGVCNPEDKLKTQLIERLKNKHMLLVLDCMEGMLGQANQISELLHRAPNLKILTTSQVRLNLEGEQILPLEGLPYPQADCVPENAEDFPAVRLFLETARRINPAFLPDPAERAAVVKICQIAQGLPLGILLSSAWVGTMTPSQILVEINKSLGFLSAGWQDMPERQRSLLATFDTSWQLLDPVYQEVFLRLAVFQTEFTAEQAMQVTDASWVQLKSLVDDSLLQPSHESRFRMHNLLRQYALTKLPPDVYPSVKERHSAYFLEILGAYEVRLKSPAQFEALAEMDNLMPEMRAAWDWAALHQQFERLSNASRSLEYYCVLREACSEAVAAFQKALSSWTGIALTQDGLLQWVNLSLRLAFSLFRNHEFFQAEGLVEKIDLQLQTLDENERLTILLRADAALLKSMLAEYHHLNYQEAFGYCQVCLQWMRAYGEPWHLSHILFRVSTVQAILNNKYQTEKVVEEAFALQQQVGDPDLTARIKTSLFFIYSMSGQDQKAIRLAQELEPYFHRVGTRYSLAYSAMLFGLAHCHALNYPLSNVYMDKAINLFNPEQHPAQHNFAAYIQTFNTLFLGNYEAARRGVERCGYEEQGVISPNWQVIRGYLYLLDAAYDRAEADFKGFIEFNRRTHRRDVLGHGLALLGYLAYITSRYPEARQHLVEALENGLEHGYFVPLGVGLLTLTLILGEVEELEQAAALFQFLDERIIKHSKVYEELFGKRIRSCLGALPQVYQPEKPWKDLITPAQHYLEMLKSTDDLFEALASPYLRTSPVHIGGGRSR